MEAVCGCGKKKPLGERRGDQVTQTHLPAQFNTHFKERGKESRFNVYHS